MCLTPVTPADCRRDQVSCVEEEGHSSLTLCRNRSAFACKSVRVRACQCVSAVQVLKKKKRQSNT